MILEIHTSDGSSVKISDYENIRYYNGMSRKIFTDDLSDFSIADAFTYNIKSENGYLSIKGSEIERVQLFND